jgi:hypothetical protein
MRLCHMAQDALLRLARLGPDRDHFTTRVTREEDHGYHATSGALEQRFRPQSAPARIRR